MIAEPAPTFAVQLASAADPAELEAWLAVARVGERAQYAAGIDLPRGSAGVVLVTRWVREGRVSTHQQRDRNDARRWQFLVKKIGNGRGCPPVTASGAPAAVIPGGGRASIPGRTGARSQMAALMDLLRGCAAGGRPCPGLGETAQLLGLPRGQRGKRRAAYLFKRLADDRRIAVTWPGPGRPRVVTVLKGRGAGTSTASSSGAVGPQETIFQGEPQ